MAENLIIASVGTSLLQRKERRQHVNNDDLIQVAEILRLDAVKQKSHEFAVAVDLFTLFQSICNEKEIGAFQRFYNAFLSLDPREETSHRNVGSGGNPDELPAELSTLYLLFHPQTEKAYSLTSLRSKNRLVLLASDTPDGVFCARCIANYIRTREEFKDIFYQIEIQIIEGLVGERSALFQTKGIPNLIENAIRLIKETASDRTVLCVTAGYKGTLPHLTLLGLIYPNVDTIYLFEGSDAVVEFPRLPIDFDVIDWNNHRGIIKTLLTEGSNRQLLELLPPTMRRLFEDLPNLGVAMRERVEEKEQGLSFYGSGRVLSELIDDGPIKKTVEQWLAQSQHIWHGDLIAEAVDHARGHAQRLHELAFQMLAPILDFQSKQGKEPILDAEEIALLASTLWIHDIGHSGRKVNLCDDNGDEIRPRVPIDISPFPSLVRDLHHYSAYLMLTQGEDWKHYFPTSVFKSEQEAKKTAAAVATCYLYHRGKMDLLKEKQTDDPNAFFETALNVRGFFKQPLTDFMTRHHPNLVGWSYNNRRINWQLLVVLQRFVDGCDVQRERTYVTELNRRKMNLAKREIESELLKLESLEEIIRHHLRDSDRKEYADWIRVFARTNWLKRYLDMPRDLMNLQKEFERTGIESEPTMNLYHLLRGIWKRRAKGETDPLDILFEEYLGCADRIVWKHSPLPHFQKHEKVDQVFITKNEPFPNEENGDFEFWVNLVVGKDEHSQEIEHPERLNEIFDEIRAEYLRGGVQTVLEDNSIVPAGCRAIVSGKTTFLREWDESEWTAERRFTT